MHPIARKNRDAGWESTRVFSRSDHASTQILGSDDYLGRGEPTIGTLVRKDRYEFFAACAPGEALQLQLEAVKPVYIAVHDAGAATATRFVHELATALKQPVQTLAMRRQGVGTPLASLSFVELPSAPGAAPIRVYSTASDGADNARREVAEVLLAFARLAVVLIGPDPLPAIAALRERIARSPWHNAEMLVVPRAALPPEVAMQVRQLSDGGRINVYVMPPAAGTSALWPLVQGAWNRLRRQDAAIGTQDAAAQSAPPAPQAAHADVQRLSLNFEAEPEMTRTRAGTALMPARPPAPAAPFPARSPAPAASAPHAVPTASGHADPGLTEYVDACLGLRGAMGCVAFERDSHRTLRHGGTRVDAALLLEHGTKLLGALHAAAAGLGHASRSVECLTALDNRLLLVRDLPRRPGLGLALLIDNEHTDSMVLRVQLQRLEPLLNKVG